jgi:hypothetical protein
MSAVSTYPITESGASAYPLSGQTINDIGATTGKSSYYFDLQHARKILREVMLESQQLSEDDEGSTAISAEAYQEAETMLRLVRSQLPMPDITWLPDGGIGFEWRTNADNVFTVSFYGNGKAIYAALHGQGNEVSGIGSFPYSSDVMFTAFLAGVKIHCDAAQYGN